MEITFHGVASQTTKMPPKVGEILPEFKVLAPNKTLTTQDLLTKTTLISVVPDINTSVCSISTKHFNQEVDKYQNFNFYTISTNTLAEQADWCAVEGVEKMQLLSDATAEFGKALGLYVADKKIDARSIWVVDQNGKVLYQELIKEQTNEPDYQTALGFLDHLENNH